MRAPHAALGLLLLGTLRAFPQEGAPKAACAGDPDHYYDKAVGRCCFRCPSGLSPSKPCPQRSADCRKRCEPDYYVNRDGRCTACVSCLGDDLVEKAPCSWNSSRICACRPGMFCVTSATKSCARCSHHSVCAPGMVVKFPGTAEKDTVCELPSPGTSPDCASPEDCKTPASFTPSQAEPTLTSPAAPETRTTLLRGDIPRTPEDASRPTRAPQAPSSVGKPSPDPGPSPAGGKRCEPGYYLHPSGRCTACLSCSRDDLVEKAPCSWNSPGVCACRPGMFCATPVTNSCARCVTRLVCGPGTIVKAQGATSEPPPLGTHPDCSTPDNSEAPASSAPTLGPLGDSPTSRMLSISTVSLSSTRKPILDPGPVLFWVSLVVVLAVGSGSFLLCRRKACRRRLRQKMHLCYPTQTFRPKTEPVDSRPKKTLTGSSSATDLIAKELSLASPGAVDTCISVGAACPERRPLLESSLAGGSSEPRVSTEHTNNKIEKVYIMKADTVIVGTVKTEAPEARGPGGPELELNYAAHYPEQETEPPLGSCGDVMFSVEEEGKDDPWPAAASEK